MNKTPKLAIVWYYEYAITKRSDIYTRTAKL